MDYCFKIIYCTFSCSSFKFIDLDLLNDFETICCKLVGLGGAIEGELNSSGVTGFPLGFLRIGLLDLDWMHQLIGQLFDQITCNSANNGDHSHRIRINGTLEEVVRVLVAAGAQC